MDDKLKELFNQGVTLSLSANAAEEQGAMEQAQKLNREAVAAFDQVLRECPPDLQQSPTYHGALSGKGLSLVALGETKAAADTFKEACQFAPDYPENFRRLGLCYLELGDLSLARDVTVRAVKLANDKFYTGRAAAEIFNMAAYIMETAAAHRSAGRKVEERRCYEMARDAWSLSMEILPSAYAQYGLAVVNELLETN